MARDITRQETLVEVSDLLHRQHHKLHGSIPLLFPFQSCFASLMNMSLWLFFSLLFSLIYFHPFPPFFLFPFSPFSLPLSVRFPPFFLSSSLHPPSASSPTIPSFSSPISSLPLISSSLFSFFPSLFSFFTFFSAFFFSSFSCFSCLFFSSFSHFPFFLQTSSSFPFSFPLSSLSPPWLCRLRASWLEGRYFSSGLVEFPWPKTVLGVLGLGDWWEEYCWSSILNPCGKNKEKNIALAVPLLELESTCPCIPVFPYTVLGDLQTVHIFVPSQLHARKSTKT